jgi:hypothetical protein
MKRDSNGPEAGNCRGSLPADGGGARFDDQPTVGEPATGVTPPAPEPETSPMA